MIMGREIEFYPTSTSGVQGFVTFDGLDRNYSVKFLDYKRYTRTRVVEKYHRALFDKTQECDALKTKHLQLGISVEVLDYKDGVNVYSVGHNEVVLRADFISVRSDLDVALARVEKLEAELAKATEPAREWEPKVVAAIQKFYREGGHISGDPKEDYPDGFCVGFLCDECPLGNFCSREPFYLDHDKTIAHLDHIGFPWRTPTPEPAPIEYACRLCQEKALLWIHADGLQKRITCTACGLQTRWFAGDILIEIPSWIKKGPSEKEIKQARELREKEAEEKNDANR